MIFERKKYLDELIAGRGNGLVKIITGVRRCGKSFLLFDIWHTWLLEHGVTDSHIIEIQLDDFRNRRLRKPDALLDYIDSKVVDDGNPYYIVLDEVQLVEEFVEVILSLTHMRNVDVYVSGSNSRFLSSDVVTEVTRYAFGLSPLTNTSKALVAISVKHGWITIPLADFHR